MRWLLVSLFCLGLGLQAGGLERSGKTKADRLRESSGLLRTRANPEWFWTFNDSGNAPELFLVRADGTVLTPKGIKVKGAKNRDWEAIARDEDGNLLIGDVGNNNSNRKDLGIYVVPEPEDLQEIPKSLKVRLHIPIAYPDQKAFPPEKRNFDCESMFVSAGKVYLLTKHWSDTNTKLYRLDDDGLKLLERFEYIGMPTSADLHENGKTLAVLSYHGVWLFAKPEDSDLFLSGESRFYGLNIWELDKCEGIAWSGDRLLISNEQEELFWFKP